MRLTRKRSRKRASTGHNRNADEDALRLSALFDASHDDSDHAEKLRDTVIDLSPPDIGEGLIVATARKADPFSALAHALGPVAMLRLPGRRFGDLPTKPCAQAPLPREKGL